MRSLAKRVVASNLYPDLEVILQRSSISSDDTPGEKMVLKDLLPVWACVATGGDAAQAVPLAVALKLYILAFVVADDLVDRDHPERPWYSWGEGRGTQVCLSLLLLAQSCLAELPLAVSSRISGELGQALHLAVWGQSQPPTERTFDAYYRYILAKSGLLFACFARSGAVLGSQNSALQQSLFDYGMALGTIIQIKNDYHDLSKPSIADEQVAYTLPVLVGLESNNPHRESLRDVLLQPHDGGLWQSVRPILEKIDVAGYVKRMLDAQFLHAKKALSGVVVQSPYLERLLNLEVGML
jgi:geranylgeranyl pyrophosphate synthase